MDYDKRGELVEWLLDFAVRIIKLVNALPRTVVGKHVGGQLLKSGTSPGANYEEACGAESRADFVHRMGLYLRNLKSHVSGFVLFIVLKCYPLNG